jgi:hypothetical protein
VKESITLRFSVKIGVGALQLPSDMVQSAGSAATGYTVISEAVAG